MSSVPNDEQDWLDRIWAFVRRRPIIWAPLVLAAIVALVVSLTSQAAAQPIATDPTTHGQPLSNPDQHLHSLAIDPLHPGTVYLGSHYGLFTSTDDGKSWPEARGRFNTVMITSLAVQPADGNVAFLGLEPNGGDFGDNGIYISQDTGKTFTRVTDPPAVKAPVNRFLIAAGARPHQWLVVYAGLGLFGTSDDGQTWQPLRPLAHEDVLRAVAVTPTGTLLVAGTFGLETSGDGGAHWSHNTTVQGDTMTIAISPADPHTVYVTAIGGIYRSRDGGATFAPVSAPLTPSPFSRLAPSRQHVDVVYALGGDQQIWRSTDGGANWTAQSQLDHSNPQQLFVAPDDDQHLYVGFYTPAVVIESHDGGQSWNVIAR